ncbi:dioxygenase [Mycolicibacterium conceptionense]|uniref:Dioxygenase n=1 Tax=Mycolicibacterium conceptionense TaxID=451644 RepID=A0A0U1DQQ0_9MYCO|nr:dioxygenase [Mycolicibacterium conceptionense]
MQTARPGDWVENATGLDDISPDAYRMEIPTSRYTAPEFVAQERDSIWQKVWQVVGRVDELTNAGDWKQYQIFDQSYLIVRGKDGRLHAFVNACRHRGNVLCREARGNAKRGFLCQYHLWSYDLDGRLKGMLREALAGPIDKDSHGLIEPRWTRSRVSSSSIRIRTQRRWPISSAKRSRPCSRRTISTRW